MNDVAPRLQVKVSGAPAPKPSPAAIGGNAVAQSGRDQRGREIERALRLGCGRRFRGPLPRNLRPQPSAKNAVTQETTPQDSIFNQLFQLFNFFDDRSSTFELLNFSGIPNPTFELFELLNFLEVSHLNF